jgi:hypothetical protein
MLAALRNPALVRPAALFSATTMAVGIIVTFLPLAVTRADANVAALALLVQPAAAIAAATGPVVGPVIGPVTGPAPGVVPPHCSCRACSPPRSACSCSASPRSRLR